MDSLWRRLYQKISRQSRSTRRRSRPPAPALRILRLERRRVLSADFSLGASGLVLEGFDALGGETLSISQLDTEYRFTLSNEAWETPSGALPNGIQIDGQTLAIDSSIVDQIVNGLTVVGNANSPLHITLGEADFSWLQGPLSFTGIQSLNQIANTQFTVGAASAMEVNASEAGVTIGSINIAGNLNITAFGPLLDGVGTEINVTGNATFISRALRPAADFDGDGVVTDLDYGVWSANFGITVGATNEQGDANGDGAVDIVDYVVWRGTLGAVSEPGGITLADHPTDVLNVGGIATFVAQDGASRFNIDVGSTGTTQFGSLAVIGADVQVAEDSATVVVGIDATSFTLQSAGSITDGPGTPINVTGLASFDAGANSITLGDNPADTINFGQLHLTGGDVSVVEDSGTELTGVTATTFYLKSAGPITDAPSTTINVTGLATFDAGGNSIVLGDDLADTTNFGQLHLTGGAISISEDSGTELTGVSADSFNLVSDGPITDAAGTTISVTGLATLNAGGNPITLGDNVADTTNFGQLHLTGGAIAIMEDSGTELTGVSAASFNLVSDGPITDVPGTAISVTGLATLNAGANPITLGDSAGDTTNFGQLNLAGGVVTVTEDSGTELTGVSATAFMLTSAGPITDAAGTTISVTGLATLNAGANPITLGDNAGDTTNFGQLHLTGTIVTITEDSSTELTGVSATTLTLLSAGSITDAPNTTISVTGLATFNAGANPITLGDNAGDTTNFGQLHLTGGAVSIMEDSGTELTGVSATTLALTSTGPITDAPGATIFVTGQATLNAGANSITLGDNAGDTTNFGQLNLTGGAIVITEDSGTELTGVMATTLNLTSGGPITDAAGTTINVLGLATLNAGASFITLGDNVGDMTNFGQLHLTGGPVSVTEDSATVLTGISATTLNLVSAGSITDALGTTINVTGLATLNAGANPITLGDSVGDTTNFGQLNVTGTAVAITEDSGTELTGVMATTLSLTSAGPITDAPNATISVTGLATLNAGANPITLGDNPGDTTNFGQLNLTGSAVAVTEDSSTELTGVTANSLVLTSAGGITDALGTSISVTTTGTFNASGAIMLADNAADNLSVGAASFSAPTFNITIGPAGTANFGTLFLNGAAVTVQEDSSTELTGVTANSLSLTSAGAITDAPGTAINVTTTATFNAGGAITLADNAADLLSVGGLATFSAPTFNITIGPAGLANFGSLNLNGAAVSVQEDSSTELTGITANSLSLTSAGAITDAPGTAINVTTTATLNAGGAITLNDNAADNLSVGGLATFSAPTFNITIGPAGTANFGSLNLNGAAVVVQEDSSTLLTGISANSLTLTSAGAITDAPSTAINVTTTATFNAGGAITLSDSGTDVLSIGGLATFSAPTFNITIGPAGTTNFGSLNLTGAAVTVQEDSATELTQVTANSLALTSAGAITDVANTSITVITTATFSASGAITLADNAADNLSIGGLATFSAPTFNITIGPAGAANFGSLNLNGAAVAVQEDSATELTGISASSLVLTSAGAITDMAGTSITVANTATFNAGGDITLTDNAADNLSVGGLATFSAPTSNISLGPAGSANFGSLNLTGEVIEVQEDSATLLTGVTATSFELDSAGAITDSATAVIFVNGPASLLANGTITLADVNSAANSLIVVELGSFQVTDGNNIDIGVLPASGLPAAANAQLGSLQFTANALLGVGGQVRVALDGPIILSGSGGGSAAEDASLTTTEDSAGGGVEMNRLAAGSLDVNSDGAITDAPESDVAVAGTSIMRAKGPITLADQGPNNEFEVGGHARFISTQSNAIDLGVVPEADPTSLSRGTATDAKLNLGSVSFVSDEGNVTASLDNAVVLANMSLAGSAWIQSAGSITDAFGADTTITQFAILKAADGSDIVLGDDSAPGDTRFRMDTPVPTLQVFDASRFLALKAEDVSIQVDSGFNLRTGPNDSAFPGTVFLQATGNISQVGHEGNIQPLEANRIAMLSAAAVLFSQVRVNSQVTTDGTTPSNLAIHGGVPLPVSVLPPGQFPVNLIPSSTITDLSPIGINPAGTEQGRPDGSGLNDLIGAQILEPAPIADGYSIIMKVLGDAKIGIVQDATATQADLVGVRVNTAGNVFLQTVADDGGGSGGMVPDPGAPEVGNIVFTSRGAPTETVVQMFGGVFTAIAAAKLTIDTEQPGSESGAITTKLSSATGTVTSVGEFTTFDGNSNSTVLKDGPRFILDAPLNDQNAATTGLIFAPEFEQRLTLVAGSRGENNLVLEVVWADVFNPNTVPGSNQFPDVALVPESIEGLDPQPLIQSSDPALDFRAITVRHNYAESFVPANPNLPTLPTTIRLYNDPAINLFDQGGTNNLNVTDNFVSPDVFAVVTGGYFELASIELPVVYEAPQQVITVAVTTVPQDRVVVDEIQVTTASEIDIIRYGRVGEDGEFIEEEGWPMTWEQGREGDFLNDIREAVNASTSLEGAYRIEAETTRGTQPLEEWTKGDAVEEAQQNEEDTGAAEESQELTPQENGEAPVEDPATTQMPTSAHVSTQVASHDPTENRNFGTAGQLVIGASAFVINRGSRQVAAETPRGDFRPDYSRAARRRRARLRQAALETV